jgi:glutathione synthase/RimK-type ligase-like ATP-grasp enzyme
MNAAQIPTPPTFIVHDDNRNEVAQRLGLPCVLKLPDSSFSQGVTRVTTETELQDGLTRMLDTSDLVIAQGYMPTDFDWRIGVLEGAPLYACKYFMARGHWQIYNWNSKSRKDFEGDFETLPIAAVPPHIVDTALKACRLIGDGLYGVDLKEIDGRAYLIEVNDNPSIDAGVEDTILQQELYVRIMRVFRARIERMIGLANVAV